MSSQFIRDISNVIRGIYSWKEIKLLRSLSPKERFPLEYVLPQLKKEKFKFIQFNSAEEIIFTNGKISFATDAQYPWIAGEVFADKIYEFKSQLDQNKKYTVFDIGGNRGYSSLFFASKPWCEEVYSFELVEPTYNYACKNILLNEGLKKKIHFYNFGLGNYTTTIVIPYMAYRDGCNTANPDFIKSYMPEEEGKEIPLSCQIKKGSEVFKKIIEKNNIANIILEIDVEGAEYEIVEDLVENYPKIFDKVEIIIGDTHLGFDKFINIIKDFDYHVVHSDPHKDGTCPFELIKNAI